MDFVVVCTAVAEDCCSQWILVRNVFSFAQATNLDSGSLLPLLANEVGHGGLYKSKLSTCASTPTTVTASTSLWLSLGPWYLVFYYNKLAIHTQAQLHSSHTSPYCAPHLSCLRDFTQLPLPGMCAMYTWPLPIKHTHAVWLTSFLHCSRISLDVTSSKSLSLMPTTQFFPTTLPQSSVFLLRVYLGCIWPLPSSWRNPEDNDTGFAHFFLP